MNLTTTRSSTRLAVALAVAALFSAGPAMAYVDLAPTLGKIVGDAKSIALVEVTGFDAATQTVTFKPIKTLKGDALTDPISNRVAPPDGIAAPAVRQWAGAGSRGVWFATKTTALVCVGTSWYQAKRAGEAWKLGVDRPDLALAYCGSPSKLADAIAKMIDGKTAVLTTVVYGATDVDTSFDLALGRTNLPGLVRVQRVKGSLNMAGAVMAAAGGGGYVIGPGPVDPNDLPALRQELKSSDVTTRAEAAESIGHLGSTAAAATDDLEASLKDTAVVVRTSAAGALLRVVGKHAEAIATLDRELKSSNVTARRDTLSAVALAGPSAAALSTDVVKLLTDADEAVRAAALSTLMTLGRAVPAADAAAAVGVLVPMLEDVRWRVEAADTLGRLGDAARPVPAKLIGMLKDPQVPVQWAAVRAMAQIGGDGAKPAVEYMKGKLPNASEVEQYNMMIYLSLLGPVAADAAPVIQSTRLKNPVLPSATLWAIGDTTRMPWEVSNGRGFGGPGGGGPPGGAPGGDGGFVDLGTYMYTAYIRELGPRLRPAAQTLAQRLLDGTAGNVPAWGYSLLTADTAGTLATLTPKLADTDRTVRQRAAVALGQMGTAAAPAGPQLEAAIAKAADEKEQRMLKWTLKKVTAK